MRSCICGDREHFLEAADGADAGLFALGRLCSGGGNSPITESMTVGFCVLRFDFTAVCAGHGLHSGSRTGRCGNSLPIAECVTHSVRICSLNASAVYTGAFFNAFEQAGGGGGYRPLTVKMRYRLVRNSFGLGHSAARVGAGVADRAVFGTGRLGNNSTVVPVMFGMSGKVFGSTFTHFSHGITRIFRTVISVSGSGSADEVTQISAVEHGNAGCEFDVISAVGYIKRVYAVAVYICTAARAGEEQSIFNIAACGEVNVAFHPAVKRAGRERLSVICYFIKIVIVVSFRNGTEGNVKSARLCGKS